MSGRTRLSLADQREIPSQPPSALANPSQEAERQADAVPHRPGECPQISRPFGGRARLCPAERANGPVYPHDRHCPSENKNRLRQSRLQHATNGLADRTASSDLTQIRRSSWANRYPDQLNCTTAEYSARHGSTALFLEVSRFLRYPGAMRRRFSLHCWRRASVLFFASASDKNQHTLRHQSLSRQTKDPTKALSIGLPGWLKIEPDAVFVSPAVEPVSRRTWGRS